MHPDWSHYIFCGKIAWQENGEMNLKNCFLYALAMVASNKLRSWLTIIGIIVGVASVVAIFGMSAGLTVSVDSQLSGLGANIITVNPGGTSSRYGPQVGAIGVSLTDKDYQGIRLVDNIAAINRQIQGNLNVKFGSQTKPFTIRAFDPAVWFNFYSD